MSMNEKSIDTISTNEKSHRCDVDERKLKWIRYIILYKVPLRASNPWVVARWKREHKRSFVHLQYVSVARFTWVVPLLQQLLLCHSLKYRADAFEVQRTCGLDVSLIVFFFVLFYLPSSGGWVKTKLKLPHFHVMYEIHVCQKYMSCAHLARRSGPSRGCVQGGTARPRNTPTRTRMISTVRSCHKTNILKYVRLLSNRGCHNRQKLTV